VCVSDVVVALPICGGYLINYQSFALLIFAAVLVTAGRQFNRPNMTSNLFA
jgi:hypothetical protein